MNTHYQVLARKYRPKNFDELIGQTHISDALKNAIDTGRLHHAYLFTGTRGVGKTTIARILAKCLNCETGVTSQPCGVCDTCVSVDKGQFIDLIEIDAASRTKVEDTRDLLENVPYAPVQGRYKVYLIDEVHMLSTHSFNALLKTLEEPPEHVKFILATTDPQKLPITIVSRCLQFVLRPLSQMLLSQHLANILNQESIHYSQSALWQIAGSAKGSVRDSLSLTDQAIAFGGGQIKDDTVNQMLGLIDNADTLGLIADIYHDQKDKVASHIHRLRSQLTDANAIFERLIELVHQMAMVQVMPALPLDMNELEKGKLLELAKIIPADVLQLYYEILIKSKDTLKFANTPMQGLEMAILRLLAFRPLAYNEVVNTELAHHNNVVNTVEGHQLLNDNANLTDNDKATLSDDNLTSQENNPTIDDNLANQTEYLSVENQPLDELKKNELINSGLDETDAQEVLNQEIILENVKQTTFHQEAVLQETLSQDNFIVEPVLPILEQENLVENIAQDELDENLVAKDELVQNTFVEDNLIESDLIKSDLIKGNVGQNDVVEDDLDENHLTQNQLTETELIKNTPTQNNPTPNSINQTNGNAYNQPLTPANDLPSQLKPSVIELTGEWTPEKWDYWTHTAYENGELTADEFALVKESTITGQIHGQATLLVTSIHYQIEVSFKAVKDKVAKLFGTELALASGEVLPALTPQARHDDRFAQVVYQAGQNLLNSPVLTALLEGGFVNDTPLGQVRLDFAR